MKLKPYTPDIEKLMVNFYDSLSEKDRRRYAAIEAQKLGHGGDSYISQLLMCDDKTITKGEKDLMSNLSNEDDRVRKLGGGRKSAIKTIEGIDDVFLNVIENNIAGCPMDETIKWTNLSRKKIAQKMLEQGVQVSVAVVKQLLKKHNFRFRKAFKAEAGKQNIPNRDEQFKNIEKLKKQYVDAGNPVMSMDVKKKN